MDNINASDFGLPEVDRKPPVQLPTNITIGDDIIATLVKWDIIEKGIISVVYSYTVPQPVNFINIRI